MFKQLNKLAQITKMALHGNINLDEGKDAVEEIIEMTSNLPEGLKLSDDPEVAFEQELSQLINKYSKESGSNTPDFILANYLHSQLKSFDITWQKRTAWYGGDTTQGSITDPHAPAMILQPSEPHDDVPVMSRELADKLDLIDADGNVKKDAKVQDAIASTIISKDGKKGVFSTVVPDDKMPVDEAGVKAEIVPGIPQSLHYLTTQEDNPLLDKHTGQGGGMIIGGDRDEMSIDEVDMTEPTFDPEEQNHQHQGMVASPVGSAIGVQVLNETLEEESLGSDPQADAIMDDQAKR